MLKLKIQLYCADEIAMGPGKADLLGAIRAHGSISAAGRAMLMNYWRTSPLVETFPGSSHQSCGAKSPPAVKAILAHYHALQGQLADASSCPHHAALSAAMLPEPKLSQKT